MTVKVTANYKGKKWIVLGSSGHKLILSSQNKQKFVTAEQVETIRAEVV